MSRGLPLWLRQRYEWAEEKKYFKDGYMEYDSGENAFKEDIYWQPNVEHPTTDDDVFRCDKNFFHSKTLIRDQSLEPLEGHELIQEKKKASYWKRELQENWKSTVAVIGLSIAAAAYAFFYLHFSFLALAVFPTAAVLAIFVTIPLLRRLKNDLLIAAHNKTYSRIDKFATVLIALSVIAVATLPAAITIFWLPIKLPVAAIVAASMVVPALFYVVVRKIFPRKKNLAEQNLSYDDSEGEYNIYKNSFSDIDTDKTSYWQRKLQDNGQSTMAVIGLSIAATAYAFFKLHLSFLTLSVFPAAAVLAIFITIPLLRRLKNDVLTAAYNKNHSRIDKFATALIVLSVMAVASLPVVITTFWLPTKLPIVAIVATSMVVPALFYVVVRKIFPRKKNLEEENLSYNCARRGYNVFLDSYSKCRDNAALLRGSVSKKNPSVDTCKMFHF